jgi:hypothetical protein
MPKLPPMMTKYFDTVDELMRELKSETKDAETIAIARDIESHPERYINSVVGRAVRKIRTQELRVGVDAVEAVKKYLDPDLDDDAKSQYYQIYVLMRGLSRIGEDI